MNTVYILIPLLTAFTGWFVVWILFKIFFKPQKPINLLVFKLQGIIPKNQDAIVSAIAKTVQHQFLQSDFIEKKVADSSLFEKILPQVEVHIDDFLNNKLKQSMPVISMFVGEKTIAQLKSVFMDELKNLFPEIMKNYAGQIKASINLEVLIKAKLLAYTPTMIEDFFYGNFSKQINNAQLFGALAGLLIGLIQLIILYYLL